MMTSGTVTEAFARLYRGIRAGLHADRGVRFLCYHSVTRDGAPPSVPDTPHVTASQFRRHLEVLRHNGEQVLSLKDALRLLAGNTAGEARYACITFDDGYLDNWDVAWPLLREQGYSAHFFVTTGFMTGDNPGAERFMSVDMLRQILREGGSVGTHSLSHRRIDTLPTPEILRELREPREFLEQQLGCPVDTYSHPYSVGSRRVLACLNDAGYQHAFTLELRRLQSLRQVHRFKVPRMAVKTEEPVSPFELRLAGGYDWTYYYTKGARQLTRGMQALRRMKR